MKKLLFVICFGFVLLLGFSNNVFAIDDFSLTWNSDGRPEYQDMCGGTSGRACSDYKYLVVRQQFPSGFSNSYPNTYLMLSLNGLTNWLIPVGVLGNSSFYEITSDAASIRYNGRSADSTDYLAQGVSVTISLSNSLPPSSDCPDCPEQEDCDRPFIIGLFESGFWGVATASVQLIVPILALFLVFRLIHDLLYRERL